MKIDFRQLDVESQQRSRPLESLTSCQFISAVNVLVAVRYDAQRRLPERESSTSPRSLYMGATPFLLNSVSTTVINSHDTHLLLLVTLVASLMLYLAPCPALAVPMDQNPFGSSPVPPHSSMS